MERDFAVMALIGCIASTADTPEFTQEESHRVRRLNVEALLTLGVTSEEINRAVKDAPFLTPWEG